MTPFRILIIVLWSPLDFENILVTLFKTNMGKNNKREYIFPKMYLRQIVYNSTLSTYN